MTARTNPLSLPTVVLEPEELPKPLGYYGMEILRMMKNDYPDRYWKLLLSGTLMRTIYLREQELTELKLSLVQALEQKFPRPKTSSFLEVAAHMNILAEAADEMISRELRRPV